MRFVVVAMLSAAALCAQGGSVEGRITNSLTGEPVRKAQVMLRRAEARPQAPLTATTDAGGRFVLQNVEPGRYRVDAERNGYVRGNFNGRSISRSGMTINVAAGQEMKGLDLKLTPQAVITGRVLDEEGEPVANANVQCLKYQYLRGKRQLAPAGSGNTNDLGEYRLFGLAPGRYFLSAQIWGMQQALAAAAVGAGAVSQRPAGPEEAYVPTYYPRTNDPAAASPVQLNPGDTARGIDLQLLRTRTLRVSGRVINNTGITARHVMVDLRPRQGAGTPQRTSVRDSDGYFELRGVAPGSYVLAAALFFEKTFYSARVAVDVGAVNVEDLQLQLSQGAEVKGVLRAEEDAPITKGNVRVFLTPRAEGISFGGAPQTLADNGSFTFQNVAADEFTLNVSGLPEGFFVKQVRLGDRDITYSAVDLSQGAAGVLQILVSAKGAQVDGTVTDADGNPAPAAQVVLVPDGDRREVLQLYRSVATDQSGAFQLRGLPPGDYRLFAWQQVEDGAWMDPDFLAPMAAKGEKVSLAEGGRESRPLKMVQ